MRSRDGMKKLEGQTEKAIARHGALRDFTFRHAEFHQETSEMLDAVDRQEAIWEVAVE